jgi:hypothetical protein
VLIGHREVAQTVHHVVEDIGGNDAITPSCFLPLCPRRGHLFASSPWHADTGCWLEAIDTTRGYVMQRGSKEGHTVGIQSGYLLRENHDAIRSNTHVGIEV